MLARSNRKRQGLHDLNQLGLPSVWYQTFVHQSTRLWALYLKNRFPMTKSIIHPSIESPEFFVNFCHKIKTAKFNIFHLLHLSVIYTVNLISILVFFLRRNDSSMLHSSKILKNFPPAMNFRFWPWSRKTNKCPRKLFARLKHILFMNWELFRPLLQLKKIFVNFRVTIPTT